MEALTRLRHLNPLAHNLRYLYSYKNMKKLNESKEYELTQNQQQPSDDEDEEVPDSTQQHIQISKDEQLNQDAEVAPFKRNFGNNWVCLFVKGEPLLTVGPHWPLIFCMVGTFGLMSYFLLTFIAIKKPPFWYYLSWVVSVTQIASYLLCALINPGIVTAKKQPESTAALQCLVCFECLPQPPQLLQALPLRGL